MNVSTGGSHILLFERDQQLTALLMSEFQLAGYECHTARTAVEVFDSIARFPVRLVLVNLAQAAAARREFWVALDTQRRGRGVQVLTFLCTSLASYGPPDSEERQHFMPVDLHIDGMLGLMGLVQTVRDRLAGVTTTNPRMPRTQNGSPVPTAPRTQFSAPQMTDQHSSATSFAPNTNGNAYRTSKTDTQPAGRPNQPTLSPTVAQAPQVARASDMATSTPAMPSIPASPATGTNNMAQQSYTDKIRAVLYPSQRPAIAPSPSAFTPATQEIARPAYDGQGTASSAPPTPQVLNTTTYPYTTNRDTSDTSMLQQLANGYSPTESPQQIITTPTTPHESGLDQLSRLIQRRTDTNTTNGYSNGNAASASPAPMTDISQATVAGSTSPSTNGNSSTPPYYVNTPSRSTPVEEPITTQTLRASPIQDLPLDTRTEYGNREQENKGSSSRSQAQVPVTPLASISAVQPKATTVTGTSTTPAPMASAQSQARPTIPIPSVQAPKADAPSAPTSATIPSTLSSTSVSIHTAEPTPVSTARVQTPLQEDLDKEDESGDDDVPTGPLHAEEDSNVAKSKDEPLAEPFTRHIAEPLAQPAIERQGIQKQQKTPEPSAVANNAMLLDIMQSLPPMPAPSQQAQPQALQGHATRTLGSVLLEGHLIPQSRLEVAQNIQRMLRGVDLNYQLGEILLMFKLLTPDQLLAASLVSYGLLTTQQIVALGRIRHELHAIGLEYDLEALLILFRILTPEQLREVRSSWQG